MASEAQRLIGISLTKIAQSRAHRGGASLHKNLLVATVLQKARYIFMEEAFSHHYQVPSPMPVPNAPKEELVGLTAEEAGIESVGLPEEGPEAPGAGDSLQEFLQPSCVKCQDKENQPPCSSEVTYIDLDKTPNTLRERGNSICLKRRRNVTEWETEEAVQSILPKKVKNESDPKTSEENEEKSEKTESLKSDAYKNDVYSSDAQSEGTAGKNEHDDSGFFDDAISLSENVSKELREEEEEGDSNSAMEIDRITSLVSFFSFGVGEGKLSRSVSTPDLCSAQAKDSDSIQQRPFLTMTV